jgi:3-methyladenine DNA glycosylase AlkD
MKQRNDLLNEVKTKLQNTYRLDQEQQELINDCVDELLKAINYTHCSTHLKGGKYTQAFIDYVEKYFIHRPKVYDWVSKDGKREYTHKQLCAYYEKAMLESPLIV